MLILDTNILIAHLGGEDAIVEKFIAWRKENTALVISTVVECEVLSYPRLHPDYIKAALGIGSI